ncbi:MAG: phage major capsid protein, partial [Pseudomonadota bacterium]
MTEAVTELTEALEEFRSASEKLDDISKIEDRLKDVETKLNRPKMARSMEDRRPGGHGSASGSDDGYETRDAKAQFTKAIAGQIEMRDMSIGVNADGGHTVPLQIDSMILDQLVDISPVRQVAEVVQTETSNYKKLINARGTTSAWVGETDTRSATSTPQFEAVEPPGGELMAYPAITNWLLQDSAFNLDSFIRENVATEFAVQEGAAFISGDASNKPRGFLSKPTATTGDDVRAFGTLQEMAAAGTTAVTGDELVDLLYTLRPSYRQGDGVAWMMNSTTAAVIRKLKDGDGNYLWAQGLQAGQPSTLLGYRVVEAEDMPDMAADAYP